MAIEKQQARYPFLFNGNVQHQAFELLPADFIPAPGEAAPTDLSNQFVKDKTMMLFLEHRQESLKNCDVNDCSDKGSEINLTLRRLLISQSLAEQILKQENEITGHQIDRANHPRLALQPLAIAKLNPAGFEVTSVSKLYTRIAEISQQTMSEIHPGLRDAFDAYKPLLEDMFPVSNFSDGPFPKHYFYNMLSHWMENPALAQYMLGGLNDIVRSYNEFITLAARFDAECCPDSRRFPRHLLLGDVEPRPVAGADSPKSSAEFKSYDPLSAKNGPLPEGQPAERYHHFVASPVLADGIDTIAELRSKFYRLFLLAKTYFTRDLLNATIRITPSRTHSAPQGQRAIPFFYRFDQTGDLFGNWSWSRARSHLLSTIHSHQFMPDDLAQHPLQLSQDSTDFLRIEGIVGKPLGTVMASLMKQRRQLGVSFSIEPVYLTCQPDGKNLSKEELARGLLAMQRLLMCKLHDLDVIFLIAMAAIFAFMVWLVQRLGKLDATKTTKKPSATESASTEAATDIAVAEMINIRNLRMMTAINLNTEEEKALNKSSEKTLLDFRDGVIPREDLVKVVAMKANQDVELENVAVAKIYNRARDTSSGGELLDRVRAATAELNLQGDKEALAQSVYPSVVLMARAEEVMTVASAPSIAHFDADKFDTAMRGFAAAYEAYASVADTNSGNDNSDIARANIDIISSRASIAASATQVSSAAIMTELNKRLMSMFMQNTLPEYVRKHTGLEHKAGVPLGGTLVLLFADRESIGTNMPAILRKLGAQYEKTFTKISGAKLPDVNAAEITKSLLASSLPKSNDILDSFAVVGDLCLPYLCCEAECASVDVEDRIDRGVNVVTEPSTEREPTPAEPTQPTRPTRPTQPTEPTDTSPPKKGTLKGAVFSQTQLNIRATPLKNATLKLLNIKTRKSTSKKLTTSTFTLPLEVGSYQVTATLATRKSETQDFEIKANKTHTVRLVVK
ncbi:MAG: hypothetical protein QNK19_10880 [Xanthomonadales bacterium]|nr:hypothetical protein [Xanthomonadales bacterium]